MERSSGILLHITSLPGKYGIGTMGKEAYQFVDFLIESGQKIWQILPLGHTGYGNSPYQCFSAFAGNPLLIDIDMLVDDGLLQRNDIPQKDFPNHKVAYNAVVDFVYPLLEKAYNNFVNNNSPVLKRKFENFCFKNSLWLEDYSFFMALKNHHNGEPWTNWEHKIKTRDHGTLNHFKHELKEEIEYYKFIQFLFFKQWLQLKSYANRNDIKIFGDLPIYVAFDSADAWANPDIFEFDENMNPINVAGVPPDYFSETGQLWGNPLYNWERLKETGFKWWLERIDQNFTLYDILRIDHFRGLAAYWSVPNGEENAINGRWAPAPGLQLLNTVFDTFGDAPIVAEDLGVITPDVVELREEFNLPGMKILQFAFDTAEENNFLPHTYNQNCVVYTGTHDNDTTLGHYNESTEEEKQIMRDYFNIDESDVCKSFIKLAWSTVGNKAIAPLQDLLRLGTEARMNFPGVPSGYWEWRYEKNMLTKDHAEELYEITKLYGRL